MSARIIPFDFQGQAVTFNADGWINAAEAAGQAYWEGCGMNMQNEQRGAAVCRPYATGSTRKGARFLPAGAGDAAYAATSSGLCVFNQSASAAFKRPCQPGPDARKASNTSGSYRTLTSSLRLSATGRPRLGLSMVSACSLPNSSPSMSAAFSALANSAAPHVGFSLFALSGLAFLIARNLPFVCLAQADDVNRAGAWSEHQHMQSLTDEAQRLEPTLTVVLPLILKHQRGGPIEVTGQLEGQAALGDVALALGYVVGNLHGIIVATVIIPINSRSFPNLAKRSDWSYGSPVTVNPVAGFGDPIYQGAQAPSIRKQAPFLCPPFRVMAAVRGRPSGLPVSLMPVRQPAHSCHPKSFGDDSWRLLNQGASPMHTRNPSKSHAAAWKARALAALRSNSSLSVRLARYNAAMARARALEAEEVSHA